MEIIERRGVTVNSVIDTCENYDTRPQRSNKLKSRTCAHRRCRNSLMRRCTQEEEVKCGVFCGTCCNSPILAI